MVEFLAGLGLFLVGALVGPWLERLVPHPGRADRVRRRIERRSGDYEAWVELNYSQMTEELESIDEDLASRGVSGSGHRLKMHQRIEQRYLRALRNEWRLMWADVKDIFGELNWIERMRVEVDIKKIEESGPPTTVERPPDH